MIVVLYETYTDNELQSLCEGNAWWLNVCIHIKNFNVLQKLSIKKLKNNFYVHNNKNNKLKI